MSVCLIVFHGYHLLRIRMSLLWFIYFISYLILSYPMLCDLVWSLSRPKLRWRKTQTFKSSQIWLSFYLGIVTVTLSYRYVSYLYYRLYLKSNKWLTSRRTKISLYYNEGVEDEQTLSRMSTVKSTASTSFLSWLKLSVAGIPKPFITFSLLQGWRVPVLLLVLLLW